jgi:hypothetical protein
MTLKKREITGLTARSNPLRGYHDYLTTIIFQEGTEEEQAAEMQALYEKRKDWDMWCYPPQKTGENTWTMNHGYDSGD